MKKTKRPRRKAAKARTNRPSPLATASASKASKHVSKPAGRSRKAKPKAKPATLLARAGGNATSSGVTFQAAVGAIFATQLLAAERGLNTDLDGFEKLMEEQRNRGRAARKTDVIVAATEGESAAEATKFVGYGIDSTHATHAKLVAAVKANPKATLSVDLTKAELTLPDASKVSFPIDNFAQHCLLNGIDQLGYILGFGDRIQAYESQQA